VPVAANVDGAAHTAAGDWPALLERQLTSPVRWTACVQTLLGMGATTFVEVGPGAVLAGTIKRIDKTTARHSVMTPEQVDAVATELGATS
jgi:[acyl-carrier-protein] S-malonyltransferase